MSGEDEVWVRQMAGMPEMVVEEDKGRTTEDEGGTADEEGATDEEGTTDEEGAVPEVAASEFFRAAAWRGYG